MAIELNLNAAGMLGSYIEYDEYVFNDKMRIVCTLEPVLDDSNRYVVAMTYNINVSGQITPRKNIPNLTSDDLVNALNVRALNNPYSPGASIDPEMETILSRLSKNGRSLRIVGQGFGNIFVNTINPETGKFVPDIDFGPKVKIVSFKPLGMFKAAHINWQCITTVMWCKSDNETSDNIDYNDPVNRIKSFTWGLHNVINDAGYDTRTISGILKIISPVYKTHNMHGAFAQGDTYGHAETYNGLPSKYRNQDVVSHINPPVPAGDLYPTNPPIERFIDNPSTIRTKHPDYPRYDRAEIISSVARYPRISHQGLYETVDQWKEYIINKIKVPYGYSRKSQDFKIHPNKAQMEFTIVDQEEPPFSMVPDYVKVKGTHHTQTKTKGVFRLFESTINISFKFPKYVYSDVYVQKQVPGRSIRSPSPYIRQIRNGPRARGIPVGFEAITERFKRIPNKAEAFLDFFQIVYQRFCLSLFTNTQNIQNGNANALSRLRAWAQFIPIVGSLFGIVPEQNNNNNLENLNDEQLLNQLNQVAATNNVILNGRRINPGIVLPLSWTCNEVLHDQEISFEMKYQIAGHFEDVFRLTGHGLPMIIASDLVLDSDIFKRTLQFANRNLIPQDLNSTINSRQDLVSAIFESRYTDLFIHQVWVESMKYSIVNPRGSGNTWIDPSQDVFRTICNKFELPLIWPIGGIRANNKSDPPLRGADLPRDLPIPTTDNRDLFGMRNVAENMADDITEHSNEPTVRNSQEHVTVSIDSLNYGTTSLDLGPQNKEDSMLKQVKESGPEIPSTINSPNPNPNSATGEFYGQGDRELINNFKLYLDKRLMGGASSYSALLHLVPRKYQNGSTVFSGLDLYLLDNLGLLPHPLANEELDFSSFTSYGFFNVDEFSNDGKATNTTGGILNNAFHLVDNFALNVMSRPTPERSWVDYRCDITTITDNNVLRHKLLPKKDLSPKTVPTTTNTEILTYFNKPVPFGPDNLLGESLETTESFSNPPEDDIIQYMGSASNTVILRGYALRSNYQVIPPTLLRYGGKRAYQLKRTVTQGVDGAINGPIYFCSWEIIYYLRNTPVGLISVPNNPIFVNETDTILEMDKKGVVYAGITTDKNDVLMIVPQRTDLKG